MHRIKQILGRALGAGKGKYGRWYGAALTSVLLTILAGCSQQFAEAPELLAEGHPFPKIALSYASGKTVSTNSFRGKVVVLNVWATWCPPCRREMPSLEALSRTLDPEHFAVIGVSTDKDPLLAEGFLKENQISFVNFLDEGGRIARQLGLNVYPDTFLIAPDGVLIKRVTGQQEWNSPAMIKLVQDIYWQHGNKSMQLNSNRQP